jgi:hypothetical protein
MGIFPKGQGWVFTAGTINWSLGLSQDDDWNAIDQITRNVFDLCVPRMSSTALTSRVALPVVRP